MHFEVILLILIPSILGERWKDPYDIFGKAEQEESTTIDELSLKHCEAKDDGILPEECRTTSALSNSCSKLLHRLVDSINSQLPQVLDSRDYNVNVRLSLTSNDAHTIRLNSATTETQQPLLCNIIRESLTREPLGSLYSNFIYFSKDLLNYLRQFISDYGYSLVYRFNFKDFMVVQILLIFISSVFILFIFRSVRLLGVWLTLCFGFLSVYSTYKYMEQAAIAERNAIFQRTQYKMPEECLYPTKSWWHLFTEKIIGPRPVMLSEECRTLFNKYQIPPEVDVKISDVIAEVISNLTGKILGTWVLIADDISNKISAAYPFLAREVVKGVVFFISLSFFLAILAMLCGSDTSFFGLKIRGTSPHQGSFHRNVIQPVDRRDQLPAVPPNVVPIPAPGLPPPEWLHRFLELQSERQRMMNSQRDEPSNASFAQSSERGRKSAYHRVKSFQFLSPSLSRQVMPRRLTL